MKSTSTRWVCPSAMLSASASLAADVGAVALTSTGASMILAGVTSPVALSTTSTADTAGQLSADLELFRFEPGAIDEGTDLLSAGPLDVEARLAYDRLLGALTTMDQSLTTGQMRTAP